MIIRIIAIASFLLLGACAQNYGVTHVTASFTPDGKVQSFDWGSGTEKSHVVVKANMATGEIEYRADDVAAFDGQKVAAEIYKGLADAGVNVTESVVRGVVTGVLGTAAIQGVGALAGGIVESNAALEAAKLKAGK